MLHLAPGTQAAVECPTAIPGFADPASSISHLIATVVFAFAAVSTAEKGDLRRFAGATNDSD